MVRVNVMAYYFFYFNDRTADYSKSRIKEQVWDLEILLLKMMCSLSDGPLLLYKVLIKLQLYDIQEKIVCPESLQIKNY